MSKIHLNSLFVTHSLVHAILLDYMNECNGEDRGEMIATYLPHIAALASTKDGVRAAMLCFWHSIVKDRRVSTRHIHLLHPLFFSIFINKNCFLMERRQF